ncbi:MAG: 1-deoxy-D-xylulose-5-phosphate reductoisomerase [Oscillospiraceae bacterium]|jgi:1-deoxy-D-xylulose-5-phosphate reductoisomerase|nr:1-deoxy-D-xylulose-5-phosphate reductoisomerase [Oscillospiraceae bacterium]
MKTLCILGSTGSIGTQALDVARAHSLPVVALAAGTNAALLEEQIRAHHPKLAALADETAARDLRVRVADTDTKVLSGDEGILACAACGADTVLNAIVGVAGLAPTLCAIAAGSEIALANKETLVAGGTLVTDAAAAMDVKILPVDSEHSAIFQALQGAPNTHSVQRLLLTASGGPFFGYTKAQLESVSVADALQHPNWAMGAKITVDSASMFNKALELIEAVRLFDIPPERIDVVVHRQSILHSAVEFADHSVIGQLGVPDMRIPIQYALLYPQRVPCPAPRLDLTAYGTLTFEDPDDETFPAIHLARHAVALGGLATAAFNGANEQANALFRAGDIHFLRIAQLVEDALGAYLHEINTQSGYTIADVLNTDVWARRFVSLAARKG